MAFSTSANIWLIRWLADLRTQIIDLLTNVLCVGWRWRKKEREKREEIQARFGYKRLEEECQIVTWNHLLSSDTSSPPSPSRISEQQSSMMSSHGEPNEKPSVEHCWLVEPITKPILQASQQSWGGADDRWKFNDGTGRKSEKLNGFPCGSHFNILRSRGEFLTLKNSVP